MSTVQSYRLKVLPGPQLSPTYKKVPFSPEMAQQMRDEVLQKIRISRLKKEKPWL